MYVAYNNALQQFHSSNETDYNPTFLMFKSSPILCLSSRFQHRLVLLRRSDVTLCGFYRILLCLLIIFFRIGTIIQKLEYQMIKNHLSENYKCTQTKNKPSRLSSASKNQPSQQLVPCPPMRQQCVNCLYRAQENLHFSRSTLFLTFSLLDKLLTRGLSLTEQTWELVAGSLLLASTKFNEVYPVTVRKLNLLFEGEYSLQQYAEAESAMLHALDFTILLEPTYQQLCTLEAAFEGRTAETVQGLVKIAVLNPNETFKHGPTSLIMALQQSANQGELLERSGNGSTQWAQTTEIRQQLHRLCHSRRLVSPNRC